MARHLAPLISSRVQSTKLHMNLCEMASKENNGGEKRKTRDNLSVVLCLIASGIACIQSTLLFFISHSACVADIGDFSVIFFASASSAL